MSAYTAPGRSSLPQRSSRTSSSAPNRRGAPSRSAGSAGCRRSPRPRRSDRRIADEPFVAKPAGHQLLDVVLGRRRCRRAVAARWLRTRDPSRGTASRTPCGASSIASASQTAAKRWMRSPDDTTSTPACRTSSMVPASTRDDVGNRAAGRVFHRDALQPGEEASAGRPRADRVRHTASSIRAGAPANSARWRGRARAARRRRESGSTSGASPDGRPAGRPPVTSAAIGFRPRKS